MDAITDAALAVAGSPWVYLLVFVLTVLDAFLVVVPSETVVVALGALAQQEGQPGLLPLAAVAAVAAVLGDSLTFGVGRLVRGRPGAGRTSPRWMLRPRVIRAVRWATTALDRRAALVLLTARFVPFGRIAVNLTAGATGFRYPRFLALTSIAGVCWALYNVGVGAFFGAVFAGQPVLAVAVSIVVAIGLGVAVDQGSAAVTRRRARREATVPE
ncbi:MAG: hypothetical protein RI885_1217 [Actinomycetota bacterium]|jgi:membrane protein DedA with SNARE-associated domain